MIEFGTSYIVNLSFRQVFLHFHHLRCQVLFITYNISHYFGESVDLDVYDDLEDKALQVFKENTASNEYIMALDWQHECYWVNPHLEFERNEFDEWIIPIFPNGDYYFLFRRTLSGGI